MFEIVNNSNYPISIYQSSTLYTREHLAFATRRLSEALSASVPPRHRAASSATGATLVGGGGGGGKLERRLSSESKGSARNLPTDNLAPVWSGRVPCELRMLPPSLFPDLCRRGCVAGLV